MTEPRRPATVVSIQGERQATTAEARYADQPYVDKYASECSEGVAICRDRGRHDYPPTPRQNIRFDRVRPDGLLVRYEVCRDCGCGVQEQLWEPYVTRAGGRTIPRVRPLANRTDYQKNEHGEEYVNKGHGVIPRRAFRDARASGAIDDEARTWIEEGLRQQRKTARKRGRGGTP